MQFILVGHDGDDPLAPARREAAREAHLASIRRNAAAGRLLASGPLLRPDGGTAGSLQFFEVSDPAAMQAYLAEEPFATQGVWTRTEILPFRLAPLPWPPQPGRPGGPAAAREAFAVIAMDGRDAGAPARRLAARPRHFARVEPMARTGTLLLGGAILDAPDGAMIGSAMALDLPDEAAARAWLAEDPYLREGVLRDIAIHRWRIGAQPYPPLPGAA